MSRSSNIRHMGLSYCSGMNNSVRWNFVCVCVCVCVGGGRLPHACSYIEVICISPEKLLSVVRI